MSALPFRLKIALFSALVSGLVLLGFGAASWLIIYRQKLDSVDAQIRALGARHPGWLANRSNFDRLSNTLEFILSEEHQGQILLLVKDAQGNILHRSPTWPVDLNPDQVDCSLQDDPAAPASSTAPATNAVGASHGPPWGAGGSGRGGGGMGRGPGMGRGGNPVLFTKLPRFLTVRAGTSAWRLGIMGNDELRVVVGLSFDTIQAELNRMRTVFLGAFPLALLLIGGGGWLVAGRALRPLRTISRMAQHITARGLDQRIPPSQEDPEIARLIAMLNGMMDRLEASFHQATRFSADASHELKTPLAVMQGELENALQAAEPGSPTQQLFNTLLEETQRLKRITRGLLLLSQADAGQLKLALEEFDLSADTEEIVNDARILGTEAGIQFTLTCTPALRVQADRSLLHMAIRNLIHNAVKYNDPKGWVRLSLTSEQQNATLTACNSGPGIPAADQPRIFERFYRVDPARNRSTDGLGLGLSLAREIVQAHGGKLVLQDSRPGFTCFALTVPLHSSTS